MSGTMQVKMNRSSEDFLANLSVAAYDVAIRFQKKGSFVELEIGLWDALREVIRKDMFFSKSMAKLIPLENEYEPWSKEAEGLELLPVIEVDVRKHHLQYPPRNTVPGSKRYRDPPGGEA